MKKSLAGSAVAVLILVGCASSGEMQSLEPRAEFSAKNDLAEFRDCLFRWASSRANRLEYHPEGLFVKDQMGGAVYLIVQRRETVSVYVHWNMIAKDRAVYLAGRCNDDITSHQPEGYWSFSGADDLPDWDRYVTKS